MPEINVSELMDKIPSYFNAEAARGVNAQIQFSLTGNQAGEWTMRIKDQSCSVEKGEVVDPHLTLKADAVLAAQILMGEVDGMRAYLMGKLKLVGDLSLAMKIAKYFNV